MYEAQMDNAIGIRGADAKAVEVFERATVNLSGVGWIRSARRNRALLHVHGGAWLDFPRFPSAPYSIPSVTPFFRRSKFPRGRNKCGIR